MTDAALVEEVVAALDRGERRVAEKVGDEWVVDEDAKQAILDYFRVRDVEPQELGPFEYTDKIPLKHGHAERGVRVVPGAVVRYGSFLGEGVIVMPGFVNIGAWVGPGTMVDTWATVGSCAQVGANVHIAGGAGIGGVLEPVNARPVIVEDDAFIGSRAIVVEGVIVGEGAVIAPHVSLTASVPDHRRDRRRARRAPRVRPSPLRGRARNAAERLPRRHVSGRLRAHHRAAQRVDGQQAEPQRDAARIRYRHRLSRSLDR